MKFIWPNFNRPSPPPPPPMIPTVSPETAQVIRALQRGQTSQIMPMPKPGGGQKPGGRNR